MSRCCRSRLALSKTSRTTQRWRRFKSLICQEQRYQLVISYSDTESVNVGYFILGFMQPQTPHQIFRLDYFSHFVILSESEISLTRFTWDSSPMALNDCSGLHEILNDMLPVITSLLLVMTDKQSSFRTWYGICQFDVLIIIGIDRLWIKFRVTKN